MIRNKLLFCALFAFLVLTSFISFVSAQENHAPTFVGVPLIPFMQEGDSHVFGISVRDADGDPITIEWYLDGVLVSDIIKYDSTSSFFGVADNYNLTDVTAGVYTIMIIISDGKLEDSIEFNVNVATSGGAGCGGGDAIPWSITYVITDEQFGEGYTKELEEKQRVKFEIDDVYHYAGVVELTILNALIQVGPDLQEVVLNIGDEKKFDVNGDGYNDLSVKLISIVDNKAEIVIKKIVAEFTGVISDYGTDLDDDGLYDYLTVEVELNVIEENDYLLRGSLEVDAGEVSVGIMAKTEAHLNKGSNIVKLNFKGSSIYNFGHSDTYAMDMIKLYEINNNEMPIPLENFFLDYQTQYYNYKHFERPPPEINIIAPQDGSIVKGDFISLSVKTSEDAVCEYSLGFSGPNYGGGSNPMEMNLTGGTHHSQSIENLKETQEGENYNIHVTCTDESGNSNTDSIIFYVDLSEIEEVLILEDIGDYNYSKSTMFEVQEEEITTIYYGYYDKEDNEDIYAISIIELEDISLIEEHLEEIVDEFDLIIQNINGQDVYISDTEDLQYIIWINGKSIISVMVFGLEISEPIPLQLVEAYLEKYPSDLDYTLNKMLILEDIGDFEYTNAEMRVNVGEEEILMEYEAEYYNNIDENLYNVEIYELVDESLFEEVLEEIQDYLSIQIINGQEVYFLDEGDNDYGILWLHKNLIVGITINNLEDGEEPLFSQLTEAYLEKYPSDLDTIAPIIELISPEDDYTKRTSKSSKEIDFKYNISDKSEIVSCSLIIDGEVYETNTDIQKDTENIFSAELERGSYYDWQIKCVDSEGNEGSSEIRTLRIKKKESPPLIIDDSNNDQITTTSQILSSNSEEENNEEEQDPIILGGDDDVIELDSLELEETQLTFLEQGKEFFKSMIDWFKGLFSFD